MREAGIEKYAYIDWFRDHPIADDLKLYPLERERARRARPHPVAGVRHPQLGAVEIGGWNRFHAFSNPPPQCLERELARFPRWLLWQALTSPRLELVAAEAEALGGDCWRVRLVAQNTGLAAELRVEARAGAQGRARRDRRDRAAGRARRWCRASGARTSGKLEGKAYKHTGVSFWPDAHVTDDRVKVEWVVRGPSGAEVAVTLRHEKAGVVRARVALR